MSADEFSDQALPDATLRQPAAATQAPDLLATEATQIHLNQFEEMVEQTLFDPPPNDPQALTEEDASSTRYHLKEPLGQGAMGMILLAQDKFLYRKVAYKHIRKEFAAQPQMLNHFYKEAQITSQLEHPGIIPVYSMEQMSDHTLAYAMKWLKGQTLKAEIEGLKQRLKDHPHLDWKREYRRLLEIFLVVCDTVHYAHNKGVIHRDLKPANIMLGEYNEIYVLDWGIAGLSGQAPSQRDQNLEAVVTEEWNPDREERTQLGEVIGTPRYMSPEQAKGLPTALCPASDQYALGLILYELTYLQPAFQGRSLEELLEKVGRGEYAPPEISAKQIQLPPEIQVIIHKALSLEPEQRYASVADLASEIRAVLWDQPTQVLPDNLWRGLLRWTRHHPQTALLLTTVVILISGLVTIVSLYLNQQTLEQTRIRRQALQALLNQTSLTARGLDSQLSQFEGLLERLVARASEAAQRGSARGVAPLQAPHGNPDYAQASWQPSAPPLRLLPIQETQKRIQAMALDPSLNPADLLQNGKMAQSPLKWSTVLLTTTGSKGVQALYPGQPQAQQSSPFQALFAQSPATFKAAYAPQWGLPHNRLLPVYEALYSDRSQYLGWAALAIDLQSLQSQLQSLDLAGLRDVRLLSADNITRLSWQKPRPDASAATDLPPLPKALLKRLQQGGYYQSGQEIYAFQKLGALPWTLVVRAHLPTLLMEQAHAQ